MYNKVTVVPPQIKVKVCFIIPCLNNGLLMDKTINCLVVSEGNPLLMLCTCI